MTSTFGAAGEPFTEMSSSVRTDLVDRVIEERVAAFCLPVLMRARDGYKDCKPLLEAVEDQIANLYRTLYYGEYMEVKQQNDKLPSIYGDCSYAHMLTQVQPETSNAGDGSRKKNQADKKFVDWLAEASKIWTQKRERMSGE